MVVNVVRLARGRPGRSDSPRYTKGTRHTQVHQKDVTGSKLNQKVLSPPYYNPHSLSLEAAFEIGRELVAQVRSAHSDATDMRACHCALQAAPLVFDFGKLWHSL
jgi:hypothetical protein